MMTSSVDVNAGSGKRHHAEIQQEIVEEISLHVKPGSGLAFHKSVAVLECSRFSQWEIICKRGCFAGLEKLTFVKFSADSNLMGNAFMFVSWMMLILVTCVYRSSLKFQETASNYNSARNRNPTGRTCCGEKKDSGGNSLPSA